VEVSLWNQGVRSGGRENLQRGEEEEICGGNLDTTSVDRVAKDTRQGKIQDLPSPLFRHTAVYLRRGRRGESCEEGGAAGVE